MQQPDSAPQKPKDAQDAKAAQGSADDRATSFRPVEGGTQMQSGEKLMVEAYAAIWVVVVLLVVSMFRRQRALDRRIATLDAALAKAQTSQKTGSE